MILFQGFCKASPQFELVTVQAGLDASMVEHSHINLPTL